MTGERPATDYLIGLMSVTFRQLDIEQVVDLAAEQGIDTIGWTGDVHVPLGDSAAAVRAARLCRDAGLAIEGYGTYWRATGEEDPRPWLDTAVTLGAPRVRVWAGSSGSTETDDQGRRGVAERLAEAADEAADRGLEVALEFHRNTLTDTAESTDALLAEIATRRDRSGPPVASYWQPRPGVDLAVATTELDTLGRRLAGLHVFSWDADARRLPFESGAAFWSEVFLALPRQLDRWPLMLEFVREDAVPQLATDLASLRRLLATLSPPS